MLLADPPQRRRPWLIALLVLALVAAWTIADMIRFARHARHFGRLAAEPTVAKLLPQAVDEREAIVVLTGDHTRIRRALELLRTRGSPLLVISGARPGISLRELVNQQVGSSTNIHESWKKIVVDYNSSSTIENAVESGRIIREREIQRVILVTSDYHMERSLQIFQAIAPGPQYVPYPVASEVTEMRLAFTPELPTGCWKLWNEYWKHFFYAMYQSRFVSALRP